MNINFDKRVLLSLFAVIVGLCNCEAAFAAVQIQPFLCAPKDGSNASWVTVQGHTVIGITVRQSGDKAGGNFLGLSGVKASSSVGVTTITNSTSSNVFLRLTLKTSTNQTMTVAPTSSSGNTYRFDLDRYGLKPTALITNMAVFVQNSTGSPGTIFLGQFVINGTQETNRIYSTGGCLNF